MLGWERWAAVSASASARSSAVEGLEPWMALNATFRLSSVSRASQTDPKPPLPISRTSSNRPMRAPSASTPSQVDRPGSSPVKTSRMSPVSVPSGAVGFGPGSGVCWRMDMGWRAVRHSLVNPWTPGEGWASPQATPADARSRQGGRGCSRRSNSMRSSSSTPIVPMAGGSHPEVGLAEQDGPAGVEAGPARGQPEGDGEATAVNGPAAPGRGRSARKAAASTARGAGRRLGPIVPVTPGGPGPCQRSVRGADHRADGACTNAPIDKPFLRFASRGAVAEGVLLSLRRSLVRVTSPRLARFEISAPEFAPAAVFVRLGRAENRVRQWIHERHEPRRSARILPPPGRPAPPRARRPRRLPRRPLGVRPDGGVPEARVREPLRILAPGVEGVPGSGPLPEGGGPARGPVPRDRGTAAGRAVVPEQHRPAGEGHDRGEPGRGAAEVLPLLEAGGEAGGGGDHAGGGGAEEDGGYRDPAPSEINHFASSSG